MNQMERFVGGGELIMRSPWKVRIQLDGNILQCVRVCYLIQEVRETRPTTFSGFHAVDIFC